MLFEHFTSTAVKARPAPSHVENIPRPIDQPVKHNDVLEAAAAVERAGKPYFTVWMSHVVQRLSGLVLKVQMVGWHEKYAHAEPHFPRCECGPHSTCIG